MGLVDLSGILILVVFFFVLIFAILAIKTIRPYQKGLVVRLGRYRTTFDSGLHLIIPFVDRLIKIDMREFLTDVPPQEVITKDNVVVTVDAIVYNQVIDPFKVEFNVRNFEMAVTKLAQTTLRNIVGDFELDEALTSRERVNNQLRQILDDATDKWGTKVTRVEIKRIDPPRDVTEAMHRQMKAERERRAIILEADGKKQSAIRVAEGSRQAKILEAEGDAEAIKKVADATKYQKLTVALGEAQAIETVFGAIHRGRPTNDLIAIRYMETLQRIAEGKASKVFIPYEATGVMGSIGAVAEMFKGEKKQEKRKSGK
ncbi:MAG: SPFH domain-containing protein [Candidatus Methanofastidiosia archaeon]